ncbi:translation initiation factor IF-3 [Rhizobium sp. BK176]|nr:translation initiation factor IF-3 [Rhizobium sp. BK181]MBB3542518.1 translation initiation factor IF-3 [Rhizobium sp. BK399]MCS3738353.1 translation initiation factor IF-3 [Rhizobium sp. BK661]MCS4093193.1 translation initiation factor IF-3 [Rhizobium sp. BK176]
MFFPLKNATDSVAAMVRLRLYSRDWECQGCSDPKQREENTTIRRPFKADAPVKEGPRSNREIRIPRVQLIDAEGQNLGVVPTDQALKMAEEAGLDLVEISPNAEPPVCKILDLGKLKYANQKKAAEARKKQKIVEVKEIKMRPNIDTHDYEVKMKAMGRFFEDGDKVKVTLKFRGREMAHQELGMKLLQQVKADTTEYAKVEAEPKLEGRQMMMVLAPK